jgi:hypothetical protein
MKDNSSPPIGHNHPPERLHGASIALEPFEAFMAEAENWLDGNPVENEDQLEAVDSLLLQVKAAEKALLVARDTATRPLHDAWKSEVALWKDAHEEVERLKRGLIRVANDFKVSLAELHDAEARRMRADVERRMQAAKDLAKQADPSHLASVRAAEFARREADEALRKARIIQGARPKGIRTTAKWTYSEGGGRRKALHWIAQNDHKAVTEFIDSYVARNFRRKPIDGVEVWDEREAY